MKKIHAVVADDFETGEDAHRFEAAVVARLRAGYPGTIVQVDFAWPLRERIVLHAYGFAGDDKGIVEEAALRSVVEILESQVSSTLLKPDPGSLLVPEPSDLPPDDSAPEGPPDLV